MQTEAFVEWHADLFRDSDLIARFNAKIRRDPETGCWNWTGTTYGSGYGKLMVPRPGESPRQKHLRAHRFSLAMKLDRWPEPCALHSCDNRRCVNPDHLREGTKSENTRDMIERGRHRYGPPPTNPVGDENPRTKITSSLLAEMRAERARGDTFAEIARRHGVSRSRVSICVRGSL